MYTRQANGIHFKELPQITGGRVSQLSQNRIISDLITDSRKANPTENSLFIAIEGRHGDGHKYIGDLYHLGCRQFMVEKEVDHSTYPEGNFLLVDQSIKAVQKIVSHHRKGFTFPVMGITGSNGKTIVKEWLYQLLSTDFVIGKNPGSYNSQLGVPLSVWQLGEQHNLGIFEAGISRPNEMENLAQVIDPTIGIFTNLLSAHDEGFNSRKQKAEEKALLFKHASVVIYCKDHELIDTILSAQKPESQLHFTWGYSDEADVVITKINPKEYQASYNDLSISVQKNFTDSASWENLLHCLATMIHLGYSLADIIARLDRVKSIPMRLEMKEGLNGTTIIDDSYSNDLAGLPIALDFFQSQRRGEGVVILSDMLETGLQAEEWIDQINNMLVQYKVDKLVGIGPALHAHANRIKVPKLLYETVEECLADFSSLAIDQSTVLVKGARIFRLERIVQKMQKKIHGTVMEINLSSIVHNLNQYKGLLLPQTKIMVMVKAFGYGSGSHEVASILQYHKVDYLGVAYADEGKLLRSKGIQVPIMVMNPTIESFQILLENDLEPSIYSISLLRSIINKLYGKVLSIHLKVETGMHRLGIEDSELSDLLELLEANPQIKIKSIYSHLAGSDDKMHDDYSHQQVDKFERMYNTITAKRDYPILKHILNSAGISRLHQYQFDMVRLGIGLYGVDPGLVLSDSLRPAVTLRATVSQIKTIEPGESVGYGRHGKAEREMKIATLSIGYADGFSRAFSKGVGKVLIQNKLAPVVGNVCMDMTMVDVSEIEARAGDDAIIYGEDLTVSQLASWINTIPYEILTSTSDRVKRVFFAESI